MLVDHRLHFEPIVLVSSGIHLKASIMSLSALVKRSLESVLVPLLFSSVVAFGQSQRVNTSQTPDFRFSIDWNSNAGTYMYAPQKWGELRISLKNSGNQPREVLCATSFDSDPGLQYARRVWLPASECFE